MSTNLRKCSQEFLNEILELYREFSCLWDIESKDFKNFKKKNLAWDTLVQKWKQVDPQVNKDTVQTKIYAFRSVYKKEKRKVERSNGAYRPKIWYYDLLSSFLDKYLRASQRKQLDTFEEKEFEVLAGNTMEAQRVCSREFLIEFFKLFRGLPCLWKVRCKDFVNKGKRRMALQLLVDKWREVDPDADRDLIMKKIGSYRSCFQKESRKIKRSNGEYRPKLWYYDILTFLEGQSITDKIKRADILDDDECDKEAESAIIELIDSELNPELSDSHDSFCPTSSELSEVDSRIGYPKKFLVEIFELYRKQECLWSSNAHYSRFHREKAWQLLLNKWKQLDPNATKDTLVKKINSFRSTYRKERRKIKQSNGEYMPKLWYYDILSFLSEDHQPSTESDFSLDMCEVEIPLEDDPRNDQDSSDSNTKTNTQASPPEIFVTPVRKLLHVPNAPNAIQTSQPKEQVAAVKRQSSDIPNIPKKAPTLQRGDHQGGPIIVSVSNELPTESDNNAASVNSLTATMVANSRDEFAIFGEHIANKLRNSGRSYQEITIAQHNIEQVCFNLIMGNYSQNVNNYL